MKYFFFNNIFLSKCHYDQVTRKNKLFSPVHDNIWIKRQNIINKWILKGFKIYIFCPGCYGNMIPWQLSAAKLWQNNWKMDDWLDQANKTKHEFQFSGRIYNSKGNRSSWLEKKRSFYSIILKRPFVDGKTKWYHLISRK